MKKIINRFIPIILILCLTLPLILSSCILKAPEPRYYIALGDSVPAGFALYNLAESYPAVFYEMLKADDSIDEYKNYAVSTITTTILLDMLNNMNAEDLKLFKNARVVTLNIGGNNILVPFLDYLNDLKIKTGAGDVVTGTGEILSGTDELIYGIMAEIEKRTSESEEPKSGLGAIISGLKDMAGGLLNALTGAWNVLLGTPEVVATFAGSFTPELKTELDNGVKTFSEEFVEIIKWIEKHAPKAKIIVNTVYNPFPQKIQNINFEFSNSANVYIESINKTIIEESKTGRYLLIDTYPYLTNHIELMNLNLDPSLGNLSFDIHPNSEGHKLLAQLNYDTYMKYINAKD
jgi:lysophospholipase L1-like esterase